MIHTWYVSLKSYDHTKVLIRPLSCVYTTIKHTRYTGVKKTKRVRRHRVFEQSTSSSNSSP